MEIDVNYIKEHGYYVMPNFLSSDEILELQELCDRSPIAMGETWPQDGKTQYLPGLAPEQYMHWWTKNANDEPIIQHVKQRIYPLADKCFDGNFVQFGGDFKVTNPGSTYMYLHFDTPYRHDRWANDFSDDIKGMQFGIALDHFNEETGGTRILPGSHRRVYHKHDMEQGVHNEEFLRDGLTMELEPGGLFCYHSRTMHSTMPNKSNRPRRLMLMLHLWNDPDFRKELQQVESVL